MDLDVFVKNDTGWASGGPDIGLKGPLPTINTSNTLKGDPANPIATLLVGDPAKPVTTRMKGDSPKPLVLFMEGDPNKPIALAITELPQINLSADIGIKPTRIHNPAHFTFCISVLGFELLTFDLCGEAMTII